MSEEVTLEELLKQLPKKIVDEHGYPSRLKIATYSDNLDMLWQAAYGIKKYQVFASTAILAALALKEKLEKEGLL